jgi:hypothetical protein
MQPLPHTALQTCPQHPPRRAPRCVILYHFTLYPERVILRRLWNFLVISPLRWHPKLFTQVTLGSAAGGTGAGPGCPRPARPRARAGAPRPRAPRAAAPPRAPQPRGAPRRRARPPRAPLPARARGAAGRRRLAAAPSGRRRRGGAAHCARGAACLRPRSTGRSYASRSGPCLLGRGAERVRKPHASRTAGRRAPQNRAAQQLARPGPLWGLCRCAAAWSAPRACSRRHQQRLTRIEHGTAQPRSPGPLRPADMRPPTRRAC